MYERGYVYEFEIIWSLFDRIVWFIRGKIDWSIQRPISAYKYLSAKSHGDMLFIYVEVWLALWNWVEVGLQGDP